MIAVCIAAALARADCVTPACFEYNCSEQTAEAARQLSASGEASQRGTGTLRVAGEGLFTSKRIEREEKKNKKKTVCVLLLNPREHIQ